MKKKILITALLLLLPAFARGQGAPTQISTQQLNLLPQAPVALVTNVQAAPSIQGSTTYYYWIVSHAGGVTSPPAGPFAANNAPAASGPSADVVVTWTPAAGVTSYDLLRTATTAPPTGACACAVVTSIQAAKWEDTLGSTLAYTVATSASQLPATLTNANAVTLPATLTAPGVFTNVAMSESFSIIVGSGCTPTSIFNATQAGNFGTDAISGTVCVPASGVTNGFSSGVHGFAANSGSSSGCAFGPCSAVAVSADAISLAAGSPIWAGNFVAQTTTGDAAPIHAVEIDANPKNAGDTGEGLLISNLGSISSWPQNGSFPAIRITKTTGVFSGGLYCDVAATTNSNCVTAGPAIAGTSQPSQTVEWDATGSGGATVAAAFQEQPAGVLKLFGGGGYFQNQPVAFASLPACSATIEGTEASVKDSTTATYAGTIAGAGANHVHAYCNGTAWVVD